MVILSYLKFGGGSLCSNSNWDRNLKKSKMLVRFSQCDSSEETQLSVCARMSPGQLRCGMVKSRGVSTLSFSCVICQENVSASPDTVPGLSQESR